ncbi:Thioredoxin-like fold [Plasmopara halstedii]|uniref:Thioredoxin-like fold n=1 Tax=Plasmopara halstedii TaxID=4781 RepID=A0A0P1ANI7_PLAHL|nr:Thioredoxin-like fold [Plasmopara halstedii]CEG42802.1 Thioredoxin-like fold [Plasmopara halstedii]|eukprot:XP_024579171.1 Thioredoxin-like fold [Plasmopara halstedii]
MPHLLGKLLTPEQIATRRAKRIQRRAAIGEDAKPTDVSNQLFIEGSVRFYKRHFVIVEPEDTNPIAWPAKLEQSPKHILSLYMAALTNLYGENIRMAKISPLLLTAAIPYTSICSSGQWRDSNVPTKKREDDAHDLLVFPESLRVYDVVPSQISNLVSMSLDKNLDFQAMLEKENFRYKRMEEGLHFMVCGHVARDKRCGCRGPELLQWLKTLTHKTNKSVHLYTSSHFGGHRYAASCIVYPRGDWFGLLNDKNKAKTMLQAVHDEDPLQLYELWRGRLGLTVEEMLQTVRKRVKKSHKSSSHVV